MMTLKAKPYLLETSDGLSEEEEEFIKTYRDLAINGETDYLMEASLWEYQYEVEKDGKSFIHVVCLDDILMSNQERERYREIEEELECFISENPDATDEERNAFLEEVGEMIDNNYSYYGYREKVALLRLCLEFDYVCVSDTSYTHDGRSDKSVLEFKFYNSPQTLLLSREFEAVESDVGTISWNT